MILTDTTGSITGAPTLVSCISGCIPTGVPLAYPNVQTWTISGSPQSVTNETDAGRPGAAPWPAYDIQSISLSFVNGGFGTQLVKPGTFKVSVSGTVVCQDTTAFAYNNQRGNCIDTGGGVVSSGFVNYATGDYGITFVSGHAPSSTVPIIATWTNIISPDGNTAPTINRPQGLDFFGDGDVSERADVGDLLQDARRRDRPCLCGGRQRRCDLKQGRIPVRRSGVYAGRFVALWDSISECDPWPERIDAVHLRKSVARGRTKLYPISNGGYGA